MGLITVNYQMLSEQICNYMTLNNLQTTWYWDYLNFLLMQMFLSLTRQPAFDGAQYVKCKISMYHLTTKRSVSDFILLIVTYLVGWVGSNAVVYNSLGGLEAFVLRTAAIHCVCGLGHWGLGPGALIESQIMWWKLLKTLFKLIWLEVYN